jgi:hypothetical protein
MHGIHDVFPPAKKDEDDPNSLKKLKNGDGAWARDKDVLGFDFDGKDKTMILGRANKVAIQAQVKEYLRLAKKKKSRRAARVPFKDFERLVAKLRHLATCVPAGRGLLSECEKHGTGQNKQWVYLRKGTLLHQELQGWQTLIREITTAPTKCSELVTGHPHVIGIVDAALEGVGGIVVGERDCIKPVVFRMEWPEEIRELVRRKVLTNSDLEMAGLLILWLVIECVVPDLDSKHVALLNDNAPTISWATKMTSKNSACAAALLRVLSMRLKLARVSPLIPMHIPGVQNAISDIPSRSFGRKAKWHCKSDSDFLKMFSQKFPLPKQNSWTLCHLPQETVSRVISVLRTQRSELGEWRRLTKKSRSIGSLGKPMQGLWEWTLTCRGTPATERRTSTESDRSVDLQVESRLATMGSDAKLDLERSLRLSQPLARRFPWTVDTTL